MSAPPVRRIPIGAQVARAVALIIAVAAAIDPTVSMNRATRPVVAVVTRADRPDLPLARDVRARLATRFMVVDAPLPTASATVLVGTDRPRNAAAIAAPVFTVANHSRDAGVAIRRVEAPRRTSREARLNVTVTVESFSTRPRDSVVVEVLQGAVRVAQRVHAAAGPSSAPHRWPVTLSVIPPTVGMLPLEVRAWIPGQPDTVRHTWRMVVDSTPRRVAFLESRPSWLATFVRRAVAQDPRFVVTSRTVTSTNVARATVAAPARVDATPAADVLVIGAPDALSATEVAALRTRLVRDGLSVVILPDHATASPIDALLGIGRWTAVARDSAVIVRGGVDTDTIALPMRLFGVPAQLPRDAEVQAIWRSGTTDAPVIWRQPVGRGTLLVSGAFDAWRVRDAARSTFEATWRDLIARAASASDSIIPPPPDTTSDQSADNAAGPPLALAQAPLTTPVAREDVAQLPDLLTAAIRPPTMRVPWHPMHSPWWILPFVVALATDWWLRRRHGLR